MLAGRTLITGCLAVLAAPLAGQARDLSGRWVLTEHGDTVAVDTTPPAPPPAAAGRPRTPTRQNRDMRQFQLVAGMAGAVRAFTVARTDSTITVTNEDGFSYVLRPGGDEDRLTILDTIVVRYRAGWDGSFLEVEWEPDGGGKLVERYQLADSGLYLRVDVRVEYQRFRQSESRLYRLAPRDP